MPLKQKRVNHPDIPNALAEVTCRGSVVVDSGSVAFDPELMDVPTYHFGFPKTSDGFREGPPRFLAEKVNCGVIVNAAGGVYVSALPFSEGAVDLELVVAPGHFNDVAVQGAARLTVGDPDEMGATFAITKVETQGNSAPPHRGPARPLRGRKAHRGGLSQGSRYGLIVKTLFYNGARVGEFIHIKVEDLHRDLAPS